MYHQIDQIYPIILTFEKENLSYPEIKTTPPGFGGWFIQLHE